MGRQWIYKTRSAQTEKIRSLLVLFRAPSSDFVFATYALLRIYNKVDLFVLTSGQTVQPMFVTGTESGHYVKACNALSVVGAPSRVRGLLQYDASGLLLLIRSVASSGANQTSGWPIRATSTPAIITPAHSAKAVYQRFYWHFGIMLSSYVHSVCCYFQGFLRSPSTYTDLERHSAKLYLKGGP